MLYEIKVLPAGVQYKSQDNLLDDALSQRIPLEHSCKTGDCGVCTADIVSGTVENEHGEIVSEGAILTCQSKACSELTIKANYYPELNDIDVKTVPCKVSEITTVCDSIRLLRLRYPPAQALKFLPGQYVDLSYKGIKRSYSIANYNKEEKYIDLHIRKVEGGEMSSLIFSELAINTLMRIEGPKGTFFIRDKGNRPILLIATGTGIAPIKAMLEKLIVENDQRKVHVYWGMRHISELYYDDLINSSHENILFTPVLSQEKNYSGRTGYVQDAVVEDLDNLHEFDVYACGSKNMIDASRKLFIDNGMSLSNFYYDAFSS